MKYRLTLHNMPADDNGQSVRQRFLEMVARAEMQRLHEREYSHMKVIPTDLRKPLYETGSARVTRWGEVDVLITV